MSTHFLLLQVFEDLLPEVMAVKDVLNAEKNPYGFLPALRELVKGCDASRKAITTRDKNIALEAEHRASFM